MAGYAGLVDYYEIELDDLDDKIVKLECWKLSNCEKRVYPRDRFTCEMLKERFRDELGLPLYKSEIVEEDCMNIYILMKGKG